MYEFHYSSLIKVVLTYLLGWGVYSTVYSKQGKYVAWCSRQLWKRSWFRDKVHVYSVLYLLLLVPHKLHKQVFDKFHYSSLILIAEITFMKHIRNLRHIHWHDAKAWVALRSLPVWAWWRCIWLFKSVKTGYRFHLPNIEKHYFFFHLGFKTDFSVVWWCGYSWLSDIYHSWQLISDSLT